jgi:hypothetical protein
MNVLHHGMRDIKTYYGAETIFHEFNGATYDQSGR